MKDLKLHHHLLIWGVVGVGVYFLYKKYEKSPVSGSMPMAPTTTPTPKTNFTGNAGMRP